MIRYSVWSKKKSTYKKSTSSWTKFCFLLFMFFISQPAVILLYKFDWLLSSQLSPGISSQNRKNKEKKFRLFSHGRKLPCTSAKRLRPFFPSLPLNTSRYFLSNPASNSSLVCPLSFFPLRIPTKFASLHLFRVMLDLSVFIQWNSMKI